MPKEDIQLLSTADREADKKFSDLVLRLQKEEKTFNDTDYKTIEDIIVLMDRILERVLRAKITLVHRIDPALGKLLCHAFFARIQYLDSKTDTSINSEMWSSCEDPLYAILLAAYISSSMRKYYENIKRSTMDFEEAHSYFEEEATKLLDEVYKDNVTKEEFHVMAKDYEERFRESLPQKNGVVTLPIRKTMSKRNRETSYELLAVAYRGDCMKFISHVACQEYIRIRWENGKVINYFTLSEEYTEESGTWRTCSRSSISIVGEHFMKAVGFGAGLAMGQPPNSQMFCPKIKFIVYMIFLVFYLVVYARVMITKPLLLIERGKFDYLEICLLAYVIITQIVQLCPKFYATYTQRSRLFWWEDNNSTIWRMLVVFLNICLVILNLFPLNHWRALIYAISEFLFMLTFVLTAVASLRYLAIFSFFGSKIELLLQTVRSIAKYMTLFLIFWVIYAICYLSLTDSISSKSDSILWQILQSGAFEILGESRDEDREGSLDNCSDIYWRDVLFLKEHNIEEVRCFFRGTLIPPLLFFYMMTAAVMLVNIFTAMLSHEYERTVEYADRYSKFHKYGMLASFESKNILPRPLNLLYFGLLYIFEKFVFKFACRCFSRTSSCIWLSYLEGRPWGSSPPDAIVNEYVASSAVKKALDNRVKNDFATSVQQYLASLEVKGSNVDEAELILNEILRLYKTFLAGQTNQTRERVNTMMDMAASPFPIGDRPPSVPTFHISDE